MEDMLEAEFENLMNTQVNVLILVFREDMLGGEFDRYLNRKYTSS